MCRFEDLVFSRDVNLSATSRSFEGRGRQRHWTHTHTHNSPSWSVQTAVRSLRATERCLGSRSLAHVRMRQSIESDSVKQNLAGRCFGSGFSAAIKSSQMGTPSDCMVNWERSNTRFEGRSRVDAPGLKAFTFLWTFFFFWRRRDWRNAHHTANLTHRPEPDFGVLTTSQTPSPVHCFSSEVAEVRAAAMASIIPLTVLVRQADWDTKGFLDSVQGVLNLDGKQLRDDELAPARHLHAEFVFLRSLSRW